MATGDRRAGSQKASAKDKASERSQSAPAPDYYVKSRL